MPKTAFTPLSPKVILGVAAHPDDLEFGVAGTVAAYVAQGAKAYYFILTDASKGTADRNLTGQKLTEIRRAEQREAAKILGVSDVFFGNYEDGALEVTQDLKRSIVRVIRQVKPDVVLTMDPTFVYSVERGFVNHTDHRVAGLATLDAVYPLARDHLTFPELLTDEGLEPHKVKTVLLTHFDQHNFYVDITATMETKLNALAAHASQIPDMAAAGDMLRGQAAQLGARIGAKYAEAFVRLDLSL
jgi:LmbE family N-acetylglucosaminyl deacetylase